MQEIGINMGQRSKVGGGCEPAVGEWLRSIKLVKQLIWVLALQMGPVLTQVIYSLTRVDCVSLLPTSHRSTRNENTYTYFRSCAVCAFALLLTAKDPSHVPPLPLASPPLSRLCLLVPLGGPPAPHRHFGRSDDPH